MIHIASLVSLLVFFAIILAVGLWAAWFKTRRRLGSGKPHETLIVANRDIGFLVGTFTITAVWVGGGYIMGTVEVVFKQGLLWTRAPVAYALSSIIGGLLFAGPMRSRNYITMLDPFQKRYGPKLGGLMYLPALVGELLWAACVLASLGAAVTVIIELNFTTSVIVSALIALLYTFFGGQYSVCYTDVAQLIMIVSGVVLSTPFVWHNRFFDRPDSTNLTSALCLENPQNSSFCNLTTWMDLRQNWIGSVKPMEIPRYIDEFLLMTFGGIPWQDYFQRVLAANTIRNAQLLSIVGSLNCFVISIPLVIVGYVAIFTDWSAAGYDFKKAYDDSQLIFPLVLQYLTPSIVAFFGLGAIGGGVMSSTDSSILAISSMFGHNIYNTIIRPRASSGEMVRVLRVGFLLATFFACFLAIFAKSIYYLWAFCSDLVYVLLFPQLVVVLFYPKINSYGYTSGCLIAFILRILGGEPAMGLPIIMRYPYFDVLGNKQVFPFKTFAMLINFATSFIISLVCKLIFNIRPEWDFLGEAQQETKNSNDLEVTDLRPAVQI